MAAIYFWSYFLWGSFGASLPEFLRLYKKFGRYGYENPNNFKPSYLWLLWNLIFVICGGIVATFSFWPNYSVQTYTPLPAIVIGFSWEFIVSHLGRFIKSIPTDKDESGLVAGVKTISSGTDSSPFLLKLGQYMEL